MFQKISMMQLGNDLDNCNKAGVCLGTEKLCVLDKS